MQKAWVWLLLLLPVSAAVWFLAGTPPGLEGYPTLAPAWSQQIIPPARGEEIIMDPVFGIKLSPARDVNVDGYDDMVVLSSLSIYLYLGSSEGLAATPAELWKPRGFRAASLAAPGDVNGDGYADVVVAFQLTGDGRGSRVHLFHGTPDGLALDTGWTLETKGNSAENLYPVAAGDVNGDGRPDLAVHSWAQGVRLYTELGAEPVWTADGRSAAPAGDVNGDGFSDLAVWQEGGGYRVYFGSRVGMQQGPAWVTATGTGLAAADLNGDGFSDLAIGAKRQVVVYYGGPDGPGARPDRVIRVGLLERRNPQVYAVGDVDGDGYEDLAVGTGGKRVLVFGGSPKGLSGGPRWTGRDRSRMGGARPKGVGDINGDGHADLALGLPYSYPDGKVVLYLGSPAGLPGMALTRIIAAVGFLLVPVALWLLVQGVRLFRKTIWPLLTGIGLVGWIAFLSWML